MTKTPKAFTQVQIAQCAVLLTAFTSFPKGVFNKIDLVQLDSERSMKSLTPQLALLLKRDMIIKTAIKGQFRMTKTGRAYLKAWNTVQAG